MEAGKFGFGRLGHIDSYIEEECLFRYRTAESTEARINLLKELKNLYWLDRVASLAARDSSAKVRHWLARNLDSINCELTNEGGEIGNSKFSTVKELLLNDSEPIVAAAVYENPSFLGDLAFKAEKIFREANQMQRCALIRNPNFPIELAEKIFNIDDTTLGLTEKERESFAEKLFANTNFIVKSWNSGGNYYLEQDYKKLYNLTKSWPKNHWLRIDAVRFLNVDFSERRKTYMESEFDYHRDAIIKACGKVDVFLLEYAIANDKSEDCRSSAKERLDMINKPITEKWSRTFSNAWTDYGLHRSMESFHPQVMLLNDDLFADDEKINQIRRLSFFIFDRLDLMEALIKRSLEMQTTIYGKILKWVFQKLARYLERRELRA